MLEKLLEGCVRLFGLKDRSSANLFVLACLLLAALGVVCEKVWGPFGFFVPASLFFMGLNAVVQVARARDALWRAARLPLDDPRQAPPPSAGAGALTPTANTLRRLGTALDDVRRARFVAANEALPHIDRALLRDDEVRFFDAVRAMISLGLGDTRKAAQQAATAVPTGSEELDGLLGRTMIAESWHQPDRLRAIRAEWERAGIAPDQDNTLARLHQLARFRIDTRSMESVSAIEARALSTEARAVGDEDLAADLEARARESAYR